MNDVGFNDARVRWLAIASRIATHLTDSAIWHEDRCTWIGAMPEEGPGGVPILTYRAFGPDLYGGTAGVGLFLAELAPWVDDERLRLTARAALRHALAHSRAARDRLGIGLYSGTVGVAYALARSSGALNEPKLLEDAHEVADSIALADTADGLVECDLMSGLAGTLIGLLQLARLLDRSEHTALAVRCAEEILKHAQVREAGLCWPSATIAGAPALLGFSHGASGIACALLEATRVTGDARYKDAAAGAFAYERQLYDARMRNWPDLRNSHPSQRSFAIYWCHGAPGIALARIRAQELGADEELRVEAETALNTTAEFILAGIASGQFNYSLCHGLCGNAEVLREGENFLQADNKGLASTVADQGARAFSSNIEAWPCGVQGGSTPGLFLGLAGIGHFYLRLARPEIPSVLLLRS
jgi:Lantibiotic modifying enzyme